MNKKIYLLFASLFLTIAVFGQQEKALITAKQYLKENRAKWKLEEADIADVSVDNILTSKHNGVTHIYLHQRYQGIEIYNAISTINILPNGEVLHATNRFLPSITERINTNQTRITPEMAMQSAAHHLEITAVPNFAKKASEGRNKFVYKNTNISNSDIQVEPVYQLMDDGKLHLAWDFAIDMTEKADFWNVRVDAQTGAVLNKNNWTTHCSFGMHNHTDNCGFLESTIKNIEQKANNIADLVPATDGSMYHVYAVPIESPLHGNRTEEFEPANPAASPFGWHDTNGQPGAEHTITRGNNAHAYADIDNDNTSIGNEPDGGGDLVFDFPINAAAEPETYRDAATTQLFYMSNMMHDIFFNYGFDEAAGNFQDTNYEFPFGDGDYVRAEAQDGINLAPTNQDFRGNANFSTPRDGSRPRMQMYVWGRGGGRLLQVNSPAGIAGSYEVGTADFGPRVENLPGPIIGAVAVADDGSFANPTQGCDPLVNVEEVNGKIVLIDRGTCFFSEKAENARNAGALAVIICNFEESLVNMNAGTTISPPLEIPVLSMRRNDCQLLRTSINQGLEVKIENPDSSGPEFLDGDFDNGIVAHEYGHGISTRLSGGRSNSGCLSNDEQMGEGWSDFFTLVTSAREGDTGAERRGIGNYVLRNDTESQGIRRHPYSTDMTISPFTYKDIIGTVAVHQVGEIWTAALWDLYWAMSEEYGWDPDLFNGTGGNNQAIQLVMDGIKMQPCSPGILDGRDAILAADRANNGGANECLIWEVFARRGLGVSADQGDRRDRNDAIEGFDVPNSCTKELVLIKTALEKINAGDDIEYVLTLTNFKEEAVTNVVIRDNLPEGLSFQSASMSASVIGGVIEFEIPTLTSGEEIEVTYTVTADAGQASIRQFFDDIENDGDFWLIIDEKNTNLFGLQDVFVNSGETAWHVNNPPKTENSRQFIQLDEEILITGNRPTLRFFHKYDIDPGFAGGVVEISTDGGSTWTDLGPHFIRNGYVGALAFGVFTTLELNAFWGDNNEFEASYVDLSAFMGEIATIRFRFGSGQDNNDNSSIPNTAYDGWFIDDVEFLDLVQYQSEACATTAEGDNACAVAAEGGTLVEVGGLNTSVQDLEDLGLQFAVFPNPAGDYLNISLRNEAAKTGTLGLFNMNGQELYQQTLEINQSAQVVPLHVRDIPAGFYIVKVQTEEGIAVKKVIIE